MLVENAKQTKRSKVLTVVAIVLLIVTAVVVYIVFFTEPDLPSVNADNVLRRSSIETTFPTDILEQERLKDLRLFGTPEVKVQLRGRKADPFEAF